MSTNERQARYNAKNKDKVAACKKRWAAKNPDRVAAYTKAARERFKAGNKHRWHNKKALCKTNGLDFNLTKLFFEHIPTTCPQCGKTAGKNRLDTMSLDRLNPALGYVDGNVEWICGECNARKRDLTYEELFEFAKRGLERHGKEKVCEISNPEACGESVVE